MNKIFNDLSDFYYLRKTIKKAKKDRQWSELNLRHDWFFNPYTVVNLPPEVYEADRDTQLQFVAYFMQDANLFFIRYLLQDMLVPSVEPIEDSASYLIVYHADYDVLSIWFFTKKVLFLSLAIYLWMKYDIIKYFHRIVEIAINAIH